MSRIKWSKEEDSILYSSCSEHKNAKEICELLPHRTESSIRNRMSRLGLEPEKFSKVNITEIKGYGARKSMINRYKGKYGIVLNSKDLIHTYTPEQWWKWSYYKTPNGKILRSIPDSLFNKEEYLLSIVRHVLNSELHMINREDFLTIKIELLLKYKIYFVELFSNGIYSVLNKIHPHFGFKPFEFSTVPSGHWKLKSNCDEYFKYVLNEIFVVSEFENIKTGLPCLLTFSQMQASKLSGLISAIYSYNHYPSMYHWVSELYPEWGLSEDDFKISIGFDGTVLNSSEEAIIYNRLKRDVGLDIKSVGMHRNFKFYDEDKDSNYVPDFIIDYNSRKIIVEYFGLYREDYGNSKLLEKYYYKTINKIEYFSSLKQYDFIYILPDEIKDLETLEKKILTQLNEVA